MPTKRISRSKPAVARYWRQVRAVQAMTGARSLEARRVVRALRAERGYQTAAETRRHPVIVNRAHRAERAAPTGREPVAETGAYRSLRDWIETVESWEGDTEPMEVDVNSDYARGQRQKKRARERARRARRRAERRSPR